MEQDNNPPARAAVKSRKRPQSRASTTSVHSAATQPTMDQSAFADSSAMYAGQWIPNDHGHGKDMGPGPQMSPEDMILQAATHMQTANHEFSMDGSMGAGMAHPHHHHIPYQQQQHTMTRHPLPAEQYVAVNASFTEGDSQMLDRDDNEDGDSMSGPAGAAKPAAARSSANNELEMRQLFTANRHRKLQDVAGELHGNERGPNSERTRQVFAMLWINTVCSKGKATNRLPSRPSISARHLHLSPVSEPSSIRALCLFGLHWRPGLRKQTHAVTSSPTSNSASRTSTHKNTPALRMLPVALPSRPTHPAVASPVATRT